MRREQRFFVLLQIALITRRQALAGGEKRDKRAVDAARLAANQFPGVGIFLLRHQAAAGGIFVRQFEKAELGRREQNHVFGQAREMHGQRRKREKIFEREIAVADGVEAVGGDARKTQIARQRLAVERKSAARQRAGAERAESARRRQPRIVPRRAEMLRRAPAASARAAAAARAACAWCPAWERGDSFRPARRSPAAATRARAASPAPRPSRTCGIRSPPFRCGCGRCAALRRAGRVFRSARFRRNGERPRRSSRRATPHRIARAARFHRARRRSAGSLRRVRMPAAAMARAQARSSASSCGSIRRSNCQERSNS